VIDLPFDRPGVGEGITNGNGIGIDTSEFDTLTKADIEQIMQTTMQSEIIDRPIFKKQATATNELAVIADLIKDDEGSPSPIPFSPSGINR
jgi:hypothetical protein